VPEPCAARRCRGWADDFARIRKRRAARGETIETVIS
jgi:hypothetical protein